MTAARTALRLALHDIYANSWRFVALNALLGAVLVAAAATAIAVPAAAFVVVLAGPVAAALVHCAVTLVREGSVTLVDAAVGLRLHWRRGLALGTIGAVLLGLGVLAIRFYGRSPLLVPFAFVAVYLVVLLGIYQLVLWTLAIADPERPLRASFRAAAVLVASRPGPTLLLGAALLAVNVAGVAAAVMPFLTLTIAYTFLAAAHFALSDAAEEML